MNKKREIEMVVKRVSFAEAEEADNIYWSRTSEEKRLQSAFELRSIFFGRDKIGSTKISKVVHKKRSNEEE